MSFVIDNKISDTFSLNDSYSIAQGSIFLDAMEIFCNENGIIDLSQTTFIDGLYDVNRIIINYGNASEVIVKPFVNTNSAIVIDTSEWNIITHYFSFDEKITDEQRLSITFVFLDDTNFTFYIPYTIIYKTLEELDIDFKILSANITNSNKVSYVLKNSSTDTAVIARNLSDYEKLLA